MAEDNPERRLGLGIAEKLKIAGGVAAVGAGVVIELVGYSANNPIVEDAGAIAMAAGTLLAIRQYRPRPPVVEAS